MDVQTDGQHIVAIVRLAWRASHSNDECLTTKSSCIVYSGTQLGLVTARVYCMSSYQSGTNDITTGLIIGLLQADCYCTGFDSSTCAALISTAHKSDGSIVFSMVVLTTR